MSHDEITSSAKVLAMLGGVAIDSDNEIYEYEDDQVKVVHQGEAVSMWRRGEESPILVITTRGKCLHMADDADPTFAHVRDAASRFSMDEMRSDT